MVLVSSLNVRREVAHAPDPEQNAASVPFGTIIGTHDRAFEQLVRVGTQAHHYVQPIIFAVSSPYALYSVCGRTAADI
jgi:hypothetical protein